jgi:hypothetical protein
MTFSRAEAVDRVERLVDTVETDPMPVPVREVWVYGDLALGLDPIERIDVYLTKELLFGKDPERGERFAERGIEGVGTTVDADWAERFPEHVRANHAGHAAPERCLAAHLLSEGEPVHLEVCNTGFENNVTQRLRAAQDRGSYEQLLDPRAACLWVEGTRSDTAFEKLREGELVFPTLAEALEMLGMEAAEAETAAAALREYRDGQEGTTVRGDVV